MAGSTSSILIVFFRHNNKQSGVNHNLFKAQTFKIKHIIRVAKL